MTLKPLSSSAILTVGLFAGWLIGRGGPAASIAQGPQSPPAQPQENRLLANLYMITGAEYHACCVQTYRLAAERLDQKLRGRTDNGKNPAVVMDLDETVFDNSGFQTVLYRDRLVYRDELWAPWERDFALEVRLIPGAKAFIEHAEAAGVRVAYMSNRLKTNTPAVIRALQNLGLKTDSIEERLLLKTDTSDKTSRRQLAENRFDVLMYFGDNLRDFSEEFKVGTNMTIASRKKLVDDRAAHLGDDWIVLPNCSYGEWERLLGPNPAEHLPPTAMPNPEKQK